MARIVSISRAASAGGQRALDGIQKALTGLEEAVNAAYFDGVRDGATRAARAAGSPVPTYVSGSTPGKVYDVATMPTRYIKNCVAMPDYRLAQGIRLALEAELIRRSDRDGSLRDSR